MHSYGGNKQITKDYLKLNANIYFSVSLGIIKVIIKLTYIHKYLKNIYIFNKKLKQKYCLRIFNQRTDALPIIPMNKLLIETDSPY